MSQGVKIEPIVWQQVQDDFQLGMSLRQLSKKYRISISTISTQSNKEAWERRDIEVHKIGVKFQNVEKSFALLERETREIGENFNDKGKLYRALESRSNLSRLYDKYVELLFHLSIRNIEDTLAEADPKQRIIQTSLMKATMKDALEMAKTQKYLGAAFSRHILVSNEVEDSEENTNVVINVMGV